MLGNCLGSCRSFCLSLSFCCCLPFDSRFACFGKALCRALPLPWPLPFLLRSLCLLPSVWFVQVTVEAWGNLGRLEEAWGGRGKPGEAWESLEYLSRLQEAWASLGRPGQAWGSLGKLGEAWGGLGKPGEAWGGLGRLGEAWGSLGKLGEAPEP